MIRDRNPDELQELLAGYVMGDLDTEEAEELHQLLSQRPDLRQEVQALQEVLSAMPYALPEIHPPQGVRDRVLQGIQPLAPVQPVGQRGGRSGQRSWLLGTVAAGTAIALGINNYQLRQDLQVAQTEVVKQQAQVAQVQAEVAQQQDLIAMLQNPKTNLVTLRGQDQMATASGNVILTTQYDQAIVVLQNLKPLPEGQVYFLWAVVDGQKTACGYFNSDDKGQVMAKLPVQPNDRNFVLAVTIEQSKTVTQPVGPMVMTSQI
jgi:anti-sigma-K factor RskA